MTVSDRWPAFGDRRDALLERSGVAAAIRAGRLPLETSAHSWLYGLDDLTGATDYGWDFIQELSLDAAADFPAQAESVRQFWHDKLLIGLSVVGDYQYLAVASDGVVWHGIAPEFEHSAKRVFDDLAALVNWAQPEAARNHVYTRLWRLWTATAV